MININKNGSAIVIEFTDNDKYLFNGKMEVALNELMIVLDSTEFVTFRRVATGDVLFGLNVDLILISNEVVTKDNIIDKFAAIGFGEAGSTDKVESINGKTGIVVLTAADLDAYTKKEVNDLIGSLETVKFKKVTVLPDTGEKNVIYLVPKAKTKKSNIYEEWIYVDASWELIGTTDISLTGYATEQWVTDQNYLKEVPAEYVTESELTAKDYATKSELPDISGKLDTSVYNEDKKSLATKNDIADMLTKTEASTTYQAIGDYALKSDLPTFDATELFTKSQDLGTLTPEFRANLDAAIAAKKVLYINDILNNVFAVITFISKGNTIYSFQAVSAEVSYALNLNINTNTVTIKLAPKGYGFNKYETEYPVSVFELTTESTNNDILRAFSSNDNGVVIPSSGDVFEVREAGAVEGSVIRDSGIVTSRVETNGKIDLVIMSNNLVDDYYVIHNIKLSYNAAQGPDSLAVDKVTHSVIDPALLTQERQATLVTRSELPKLVTLTQSEYDALTPDANTYYFIKEA